MKNNKGRLLSGGSKAFTLVELVVVVTILAILATIGFTAYTSYLSSIRDVNRVSQVNEIIIGLASHETKGKLPIPDESVEVRVNGERIAWQGEAGGAVLETINYSTTGTDPETGEYFPYYLTNNKKYYEVIAYLDSPYGEVTTTDIFAETYAADYSDKHIYVLGHKLGILTEPTTKTSIHKVPSIQTAGFLDVGTATGTYVSHLSFTDSTSGDASILDQLEVAANVGGKFCKANGGPITCIDPSVAVITPVNGACSSTHYTCTSGNSTHNVENAGDYTWDCESTTGGTTDNCTEVKAEVPLYTFTTHRFENCNITGTNGPTLANCITFLASYPPVDGNWHTDTANYSNAGMTGYQLWTVPSTGSYTIETAGAGSIYNLTQSYGYIWKADFELTKGEKLVIAVGQQGTNTSAAKKISGGGGGTFVVRQSDPVIANLTTSDILMIAGGGGGTHNEIGSSGCSYVNGVSTTTARPDCASVNAGGINGNGGTGGAGAKGSGGGGGFLTDGTESANWPGLSFYNGLIGGNSGPGVGGFGGGSGGDNGAWGAGGGGGYSGGGGSTQSSAGGGGGSINNGGINQVYLGTKSGNGYAKITKN